MFSVSNFPCFSFLFLFVCVHRLGDFTVDDQSLINLVCELISKMLDCRSCGGLAGMRNADGSNRLVNARVMEAKPVFHTNSIRSVLLIESRILNRDFGYGSTVRLRTVTEHQTASRLSTNERNQVQQQFFGGPSATVVSSAPVLADISSQFLNGADVPVSSSASAVMIGGGVTLTSSATARRGRGRPYVARVPPNRIDLGRSIRSGPSTVFNSDDMMGEVLVSSQTFNNSSMGPMSTRDEIDDLEPTFHDSN